MSGRDDPVQAQLEYIVNFIGRIEERIDAQPAPMSHDEVRDAVASGFMEGVRRLSSDTDFVDQFWRTGLDKMTTAGSDRAATWVGKKILVWAAGVFIAAGLYFAGKAGLIK